MRTVTIHVDNSRVMDSHESAYLRVTSPSGRSLNIKKARLDRATDEQLEAWWKVCGDPMVRRIGPVEVTIDDMNRLLELSRL